MMPGICVDVADEIHRASRMLPPQSAPGAGWNKSDEVGAMAMAGWAATIF
jgi:hypothetical protein